jgi:hypothetical protein
MLDVESFLSASAGFVFSSALTMFLAKRYLSSLEESVAKIAEMEKRLTEVTVKMELKAHDSKMIHEHDKKIAVIENEIFGKKCKSKVQSSGIA